MTVTFLRRGPGAPGGTCNVCGLETGNLVRHRPSCARRHGRVPASINLTEDEERLIHRAGTHAVHDHLLTPALRWAGRVTDLHVARLVHEIEKGAIIVPSRTGKTWVALTEIPKMERPSITAVVNEALRLQVVHHGTERTGRSSYLTFLVPAPTHARSAARTDSPACKLYAVRPIRWRLIGRDGLAFVDCQACMDLPLSCIAAS